MKLLFLSAIVLSLAAEATPKSKTPVSPGDRSHRAQTEINFENQLVEGKSATDLGSIVEGAGNPSSATIIDLREDFSDKLLEEAGGNLP